MALFRIDRRTELTPDEAWRRLTDWERHGDGVPLTRVVVRTAPPTGRGTVFSARTGLGRLCFEDPMEITRWQPPVPGTPGRCRLEKRGRTIRGWAEIEVGAAGSGAYVVWREELRVRGVPGALDPLTALAGRVVFGRAAKVLLRDTP
ncbi:SRPBCC family protein [Streptomyces sp. NBC_00083]|uniref:SRPBCC family protein n=1 Tax=Streptomyces sp. NBC_00083 TaxID=2975647 RepID=UPI00225073F3|nr:SRPBCC family protein [Streptomyces sp. NBC_00083]MCX5383735.1 SRPBCC family protein [Streptomyces sp. NBC_00083]